MDNDGDEDAVDDHASNDDEAAGIPSTSTDSTATVSRVARKAPGPDDLSAYPDAGPTRPLLKTYPVTNKGGRQRAFRSAWYERYSWLEYSVLLNAVFCFACRHFGVASKIAETTFTVGGFQNWKKAQYSDSGFPLHDKCEYHVDAMLLWAEFDKMKATASGSVVQMQSEVCAKQISENRHYLKTIAEVLLLTATQNIAQRGHRDSESGVGLNVGNFRKLLHLAVRHDSVLSSRFLNNDVVTRYTSSNIQNEILATLADMVREQILDEVKKSKYFSLLVDESKDMSKREQISIVLRFFHDRNINECFLDFKPANGLDAKSLSALLLNTLHKYGLDVACCVGQGYDGASVMSGAFKGVQKLVRDVAPFAIYVHCYAHRLNLVLVDCCKSVLAAREFFALLERLYVFTSGSLMHKMWEDAQKELYPNTPPRQLQRLSDTRWCCRVVACVNIRDRLDAIISFLEDVVDGASGDRAVEARGLLAMIDFKFVLLLNLFCDLLGTIKLVSMQLQAKSLDTAKAVVLVETMIGSLKDMRMDDNSIDKLFSVADEQCKKCNISTEMTQRRQRKIPRRLNDAVVLENVGHRTDINSKSTFRQDIFYCILDCMVAELERRFGDQSSMIMTAIQAFNPKDASFLDQSKLSGFIELYHGNAEDIAHEIYQLKRLLERSKADKAEAPSTVLELANFLEPYKMAFMELHRLLIIALVLPVSSASCERTFSSMKLIKSHLRTTMCDSRLSNLAVLSVESARAESLNLDVFVDEFDSKHQNRKLALH